MFQHSIRSGGAGSSNSVGVCGRSDVSSEENEVSSSQEQRNKFKDKRAAEVKSFLKLKYFKY